MHLVIAFAAPASEAGRDAAAALRPARLRALLARLQRVDTAAADRAVADAALSFTPPHERVLAEALGWRGEDGRWPFAARAARAAGIAVGERAWGLVTPAHWHVGADRVTLGDPEALGLADADARALFDAVADLFASEGFEWVYGDATHWFVAHASLAGLATASLDRVVGRNVDRWLGADPAARRIRRLQSEAQMVWHAHPVNAERERRGLPPVNSFWLSGCGVAQPERAPAPRVELALRGPALAEDWEGWRAAWDALERGALAEFEAALDGGDAAAVRLTLAGERAAATFAPAPGGLGARVRRLWRRPDPAALLDAL